MTEESNWLNMPIALNRLGPYYTDAEKDAYVQDVLQMYAGARSRSDMGWTADVKNAINSQVNWFDIPPKPRIYYGLHMFLGEAGLRPDFLGTFYNSDANVHPWAMFFAQGYAEGHFSALRGNWISEHLFWVASVNAKSVNWTRGTSTWATRRRSWGHVSHRSSH